MRERLVVDASVAAKWFLKEREEDVLIAEDLLLRAVAERAELHAPAVLTYEVGNLLLSAARSKPPRLDEEHAAASMRRLFAAPIRLHALSADEAVEALHKARRFSKSFYDMTYLHLAEQLDCKLCTADERAVTSTHKEFPADRIVLLSQLAAEQTRGRPSPSPTDTARNWRRRSWTTGYILALVPATLRPPLLPTGTGTHRSPQLGDCRATRPARSPPRRG